MNTTYMLPKPQTLGHWGNRPATWLGDYDENGKYQFTPDDALAASGDCFITLATRLDKLAQGLEYDSAEQIELEHVIRSLMYLQEQYDVVAKRKRRPERRRLDG